MGASVIYTLSAEVRSSNKNDRHVLELESEERRSPLGRWHYCQSAKPRYNLQLNFVHLLTIVVVEF